MVPSPYSAENDTLMVTPQMAPLSDLMELDELLPIEQDDMMKSSSSLSFYPCTFDRPVPRKSVSFGGIQSIDYIESARDMSMEDVEDRWFTREQLQEFKASARTLAKLEYHGKPISNLESTRGMDVYFPQRQRSHSKYVKSVLEAYHVRCKGDPELVAQLCEKWSTKSRDRSMLTGIEDFYSAYVPAMQQLPLNRNHSIEVVPERQRSL